MEHGHFALAAIAVAAAAFAYFARARAAVVGGAVARAVDLRRCLPRAAVAECVRAARAATENPFGPVNAAELARLGAVAARHGLRAAHLVAVRTMEVARRVQRLAAAPARDDDPAAIAEVVRGGGIVAAAVRVGRPPMVALRWALAAAGLTRAEIRAAEAGNPPAGLSAHLRAQVAVALEADLGSRVCAERTQQASREFELRVEAHLRQRGLAFETEAAQRAAGPAGGPTPDFLFRGGADLDGDKVYWLDAKNYMMYGSALVTKKNKKQAEKYTRAFGPGAFIFNGGVVCGAGDVSRTLMLDGSEL